MFGRSLHSLPNKKNRIENTCVMSSSQDVEFGRDRCESVFRNPICNASLAFADGQEARLVTCQDGRSVNNPVLIFTVEPVYNVPVFSGHPLLSGQFSKLRFFVHTNAPFVTCIRRPPL